jgi:hypothetical protein
MSRVLYPAKTHRDKVFEHLQPNAVVYLVGEETRQRHQTDRDIAWRQESNAYYMSGLEIPSSKIIATRDRLALFVPPVDEELGRLLPCLLYKCQRGFQSCGWAFRLRSNTCGRRMKQT